MAAWHWCRLNPGRLPDERVMAEDFWPENGLEIEQLITEVRAARGGVLLPAKVAGFRPESGVDFDGNPIQRAK